MLTRFNDLERMFRAMHLLRNNLDTFYTDPNRTLGWGFGLNEESNVPKTNLYDCGDKLEVQIEVPGIKKEDLSIRIQGNYLELSGQRGTNLPEGYAVHRTERKKVTFTRSFTLPAEIDSDQAAARLDNGILYLSLPKAVTAQPRKILIG